MFKFLIAPILILALFLSFFAPVVSAKYMAAPRKPVASATPSPSPIVEQVNSYELFWPVTAGKVMGEQLYFLKTFKENFREFFIFSDAKKIEYNMTLSEKRTVEAEKLLLDKKDYQNAKLTLDQAQAKREKTRDLYDKAKKSGRNVVDAKSRLVSSFERQGALLNYISIQITEDQKKLVLDNIDGLNATLAKIE